MFVTQVVSDLLQRLEWVIVFANREFRIDIIENQSIDVVVHSFLGFLWHHAFSGCFLWQFRCGQSRLIVVNGPAFECSLNGTDSPST